MAEGNSNGRSSPADDRTEIEGLAASGSGADASVLKRPFNFLRSGGTTLVCVLLLVLVVWAFLPSLGNGFVDYDDDVYVTSNVHVQHGLTWENVRWAFTNLEAGFWHPLTWLSHMLDVELFGLKPAGHHATNLLFHLANTLLLFLVLKRMMAAIWASAWVAALFAVHPLHVESVAWVAERKDVLCAFFFLLSLWAYGRYAGGSRTCESAEPVRVFTNAATRGHGSCSALFYALALLFFVLGLMSKPMVVTLPLVLLLLDWWPLGRLKSETVKRRDDEAAKSPFLGLIWEKLPFLALAGALTLVTFYAEKKYGAISNPAGPPVPLRLANGLVAYVRYLGKTIWPADLVVLYPYPQSFPVWQVCGAGAFLLGATVLAIRLKRKPFMAVGWFWYLGTLLPVIGLIQVGSHSMADRYTYLPLIGVLVLLAWGARELTRHWRCQAVILSAAGIVAILLCVVFTRKQIGYWKDGETLFRHATAVTKNNSLANYNFGVVLFNQGRFTEAISQFQEALRLKPDDADARFNYGVALGRQGRLDEAISQLEEALKLRPDHVEAHCNLGVAFTRKGRLDEAISQYREALRLKPDYSEAKTNLSIALSRKEALERKPATSSKP